MYKSMTAKQEIDVFEEIEQIREKNGKITPEMVVNYARGDKTALHRQFTWDNTKAAELYRLREARDVLKVFVKVEKNDKGKDIVVRALISLPSDRSKGHEYRRIEDVLNNPEWRAEMLEMAKGELRTFQRRYRALTELAAVHTAIENALSA